MISLFFSLMVNVVSLFSQIMPGEVSGAISDNTLSSLAQQALAAFEAGGLDPAAFGKTSLCMMPFKCLRAFV